MRVLHVMTAFPRHEGDVIVPWLLEMLKRLRAEGVEVEVLTSSHRGLKGGVFQGIPVHRFRYFPARWERLTHEETAPDRMRKSLLYRLMPGTYVAAGMLAAWRLARRGRYDVIHVHWPMPHALLGWAASRASGAPVVQTWYSVELKWITRSLPMLTGFLRWAIRSASRNVAISSTTAAEVRRLADVPVEVIPYTVSLPPAEPRVLPADAPFTILSVGRLVERKGNDVLLRALAALRPKVPRARVVIVGDGPERGKLEALARELGVEDAVELRGRVSDDDLRRAYRESSVFALPAIVDARGDTEGLGVVLLEAMNYAVPVVASAAGGIVDVVEDGASGLLLPPGDVGALAAALERLANDEALAARLGAGGRERLRTRFTWESIVGRWRAIYDEVAARRA